MKSTVRGSGCNCSTTKQFQLNRADVRALQLGVSIYPNPVSDALHVVATSGSNFSSWNLYNSVGALVMNGSLFANSAGSLNQSTIDVSGLTAGIYMLKVAGGSGVYQQSIVVGSNR